MKRVRIECAFGLLKGRFRILRTGIFGSAERINRIVGACFLLHNFIQERDGQIDDLSIMANELANETMTIGGTDTASAADEDVLGNSVAARDSFKGQVSSLKGVFFVLCSCTRRQTCA